eukprot:502051_1
MLQQAVKLRKQLIQSIDDPKSQVWDELYDFHKHSSGINNLSPNELNTILLQQKQFWLTNDNKNNFGSIVIEHILKYLKFYGYHDGDTPFYGYHYADRISIENRKNCLGNLTICVTFCCITFEKFDLMKQLTDPRYRTSAVLPFVTDFSNLYTSSDYEDMFYHTFLLLHTNTNAEWQSTIQVQTGFLMIFG